VKKLVLIIRRKDPVKLNYILTGLSGKTNLLAYRPNNPFLS